MAKGTQEAVQAPAPGVRPIKKITVSDVLGGRPDIKAIVKHDESNPGAPLWLLDVIGIATAARPGTVESTDQPYVRFLGMFEATNFATGQVFRSGAAILPGAIPDQLFGALQLGNAVQFGFKIGVKFDETAATQYIYIVESLTKAAPNDPLAMLAAAIKAGGELPSLPALSGPTTLAPEVAKSR